MQIKALAAAGVLALLFQMPAAKAADADFYDEGPQAGYSTDIHVQLTQYYGGDNNDDEDYGGGRDYDRGYDRDYNGGYDRGQYLPLPPAPPIWRHRVSCWRGARYVERAGYYRVRMIDCEAPVYAYRAVRRDRAWIVRLSARSGRILTVRPISRRY